MIRKYLIHISFAFLMLVSFNSIAQPYKTGIGIRLGGISQGITVKHFVNSNAALEGILSFGRHSVIITGLYEKHQPFPKADGLSWFYGGGLHVGFISGDYSYYYFYYKSHKKVYVGDAFNDSQSYVGADFILGMEYKFKDAPIALSLDLKPFVDFVPGVYGYWEGALTFRFTL